MPPEEARQLIVESINQAVYKETDSSLHDSDKNRLLGSEHYKSGRAVVKPSPWAEGDFQEKMATLETNLDSPYGIAVDKAGTVFLVDTIQSRVRKIH